MPAVLSLAAIKVIEKAVDELFDKAKARYLGPAAIDKRIYLGDFSSPKSLPGIFMAAAREEGAVPDKDIIAHLTRNAANYLDAYRSSTKAQVVKDVQAFLQEAAAKGVATNVETVLGGKLADTWGKVTNDVKRLIDTEASNARNMGALEGIIGVNTSQGIEDPVVYFVVVRDEHLCDECKRLHLLEDETTPKLWYLSELKHGYHKRKEPFPALGGEHPHCRCTLVTLMPGYGFGDDGMVKYVSPDHDEMEEQRGSLKKAERTPKLDPRVKAAFEFAHQKLGGKLDGACVEASSLMHHHLRSAGVDSEVIRRDLGGDEGHWTVRVGKQEYDPTVNYWNGGPGGLHIVGARSPHRGWPITGTSKTDPGVAEFADETAGLYKAELEKMAIADIPPGPEMPGDGQHFDYSHLLSDDERAKGMKVIVRSHVKKDHLAPGGESGAITAKLMAPHGNRGNLSGEITYNDNGRESGPEHVLHGAKGLRVHVADVTRNFRGMGYGQRLYEALYAHAHHKHGAKFVTGGFHSTTAHAAHQRLAAKHGMEYRAERVGPTANNGEFDDAFDSYHYAIKSEEPLEKSDWPTSKYLAELARFGWVPTDRSAKHPTLTNKHFTPTRPLTLKHSEMRRIGIENMENCAKDAGLIWDYDGLRANPKHPYAEHYRRVGLLEPDPNAPPPMKTWTPAGPHKHVPIDALVSTKPHLEAWQHLKFKKLLSDGQHQAVPPVSTMELDGQHHVLDGDEQLQAAKDLGYTHVPVRAS